MREALFDAGDAEQIVIPPEAAVSLMLINIICLCNCVVMFDMIEGSLSCRVICIESSHGG